MRMLTRARSTAVVVLIAGSSCSRRVRDLSSDGTIAASPRVIISEVMANPRLVADADGEWFEVRNIDSVPVDLRGWTIASRHDRGVTIDRSIRLAAGARSVLARNGNRNTNGGVDAAFAYGDAVALGNGADWLALRTPDGITADSVAWTSTISGASRALRLDSIPNADVLGSAWITSMGAFGRGDNGSPGQPNADDDRGSVSAIPQSGRGPPPRAVAPASRDSALIVRILDVGQGDAILIENGGSRVFVDGGPEPARFGRILDSLDLDGTTIDAVIITHQHYDHYAGLRELFRSRRRIAVRYLFDNRDPYAAGSLAELRDSIVARAKRGELAYRDTDDPCGTGSAQCTITLGGGAKLHVLRPDPAGDGPNNRSTAVKLVAADSTRFSMWLAGDAEQQEIAWFDSVGYDIVPGMRATVMKADHHGSCDGISSRYLELVQPSLVVMSLDSTNDYGYVHTQTLDLLQRHGIPWYRTDLNGTITITLPTGRGPYRVTVERGISSEGGRSDRPASSCGQDTGRNRR